MIFIFMLWVFDTRKEIIVQEYIPESEAMNHEDLLDFQQREEDETFMSIRNINHINESTGIQNLMSQLVDAIQPSRSGISYNSLIKIDGEGDVTYEVV